jgi:soluble lytic murein transglycosylase-like protein
MPSKLRLHWIPEHTSADDFKNFAAASADWVKIVFNQDNAGLARIPYLEQLPRVPPQGYCTIVARIMPLTDPNPRGFASVADAVAKGQADADGCWASAQDAAGRGFPVDHVVWECRNEGLLGGSEPPALTAAYQAAFLGRLHEHGLRGACGCFGVGWPGTLGGVSDAGVDWTSLQPILDAMNVPALPSGAPDLSAQAGDVLCLHSYWYLDGPNATWASNGDMRWPQEGGRYLQCPWQVPILITECGVNQAVGTTLPNGGWQTLPGASTDIQAATYLGQLAWFDQQLMADPRVRAAFVFTYDWASRNWESFDLRPTPPWKGYAAYVASEPAHTVWGSAAVDRWAPLIQYRAAGARPGPGLDPHVVAAVIAVESDGACDAESQIPGHSAGAVGLMQVLPLEYDPEEFATRPTRAVLLNPDQNLKTGCAILAANLSEHAGNLADALCEYNGGDAETPGTVDGETYLGLFNRAWSALWPGLANPVTGAVAPIPPVTPVTPPAPASPALPQQETAGDALTLSEKCTWWTEEMARQQQAGNTARATAILDGLINLKYGLMYRLESVLKAA